MEISVSEQYGLPVVKISGDLDSSSASQAEQEIFSSIDLKTQLVLDMTDCRYISSAGLRVLLMVGKQLKAQGGTWALAGVSEEIIDIMDMTGFSTFFTIFSTVEQAAESLSKQ